MIVAMQESASEDQIQQVIDYLVNLGFEIHRSTGARQTVLGAVGAGVEFDIRNLEVLSGVQARIASVRLTSSRAVSFRPEGTIIHLPNGVELGGPELS